MQIFNRSYKLQIFSTIIFKGNIICLSKLSTLDNNGKHKIAITKYPYILMYSYKQA